MPVIILRIGHLYRPGMDEDQVYDATRGWWRASGSRRNAAVLAVAVSDGVVRGMFEIERWEQRPDGRWGFIGRPVEDHLLVIGRDVSYLFRRGAANPVMYSTLGALLAAPVAPLGLLSDALEDAAPLSEQPAVSEEEPALEQPPPHPGQSPQYEHVRRLTEQLARDPLFHASLGSKELFHSNVLAWLCEKYPPAADELLAPWLDVDEKQRTAAVLRERRQLDLVVLRPARRPIVFENKVFSPPDEAQLDRYAEANVPAVVEGPAKLVLLSLGDPGWPEGQYTTPVGDSWVWHSYDDLASALEDRCLPLLQGFDRDFLAAYVRMLRTLISLLESVLVVDEQEPVELSVEWKPLLAGVRLWDAARKLRSRQVANLLRSRLSSEFEVATDFRDANTVITIEQRTGDARCGWQLQGKQFRRMVLLRAEGLYGKGPELKRERAQYCANHLSAWFDTDQMLLLARRHHPLTAPMKNTSSWLHFDPDFVYRYVKVTDLTIAQLVRLSDDTLAQIEVGG